MIKPQDIVTVRVDGDDFKLVHKYADLAYQNRTWRSPVQDASPHAVYDMIFAGQLGQFAATMHLTGDREVYVDHEDMANMNMGDGGWDIEVGELQVDVKTSLILRGGSPLKFHLPIQECELKPKNVYVAAFVEGLSVKESKAYVYLVGYITGEDLIQRSVESEKFVSKYVIACSNLRTFRDHRPGVNYVPFYKARRECWGKTKIDA